MKRSATRSPWEVEEFASSSGNGVGEIEADRGSHTVSLKGGVDSVSKSVSLNGEVDSVSKSVLHAKAEAVEAPSPSHVATSEFGSVGSPSRSELDKICRGASPASLSGALQ